MSAVVMERRIFVVGVPRSGTTLVQSLLAAHSRLTSFTESHFFSRHFRRVPGLSAVVLVEDPGPRVRDFLVENGVDDGTATREAAEISRMSSGRLFRPLATRAVARQLLTMLDHLAVNRDSSIWVEKTAQHLHYLRFIERLEDGDPPAHFVHVLRDGLDTVASLHVASRRWESRPYSFARGPAPPYDLDTCVSRWNTDVAVSLERVSSPIDHFIFYEDLTDDPKKTLVSLLGALGLCWEPTILKGYAQTAERLIAPFETWKEIAPQLRRSDASRQTLTQKQRTRVAQSLRRDLYAQIREEVSRRAAA